VSSASSTGLAPVRVLANEGRGTSIFGPFGRTNGRLRGRFDLRRKHHRRLYLGLGHVQQLGPRRRGEGQFGARQPVDHLHGVQIGAAAGLDKQRVGHLWITEVG
jgi:hypothetical protein